MFALSKKKYTCLICHEDVNRPCFLNLNCNCDYNCHFKCFNNGMVKPVLYVNYLGKPFWRKKKRKSEERTPPRRVLTTAEIERRLERLPDDNENERKTLKFVFFFMVLFWFIYNYLK